MDDFSYVNIHDYFVENDFNETGEADLYEAVSGFSCINKDVEYFLKNNAMISL